MGGILAVGTAAVMVIMVGVAGMSTASAQTGPTPVGLGTAGSFAVLAGSTVTNTGPSVISGDVGVSPGSAIVGFPPGIVVNGVFHPADAVAAQAQADLTTAYNDAAGRSPVTAVGPELGGLTLAPGVYGGGTLEITGTLTLDAQGDPNAVFIFQAASTLITASASSVSLINGADPCNVYWQVGSSATLGTGSDFVGTILALTSITAQTGADVEGRLLARNGAVTLDTNTITRPDCAVTPPTTPTVPPTTPTVPPTIPPVVVPPIVIPPIVIGPIEIPGITIPGIGGPDNGPNFPGFPGFPGHGDEGDKDKDRDHDRDKSHEHDRDKSYEQDKDKSHEKDSHKSYDNADDKSHEKSHGM